MATVYIETTIPSFYHTRRTSVQATAWSQQTRLWWNTQRKKYTLVTSSVTFDEILASPTNLAGPRAELIADLRLLDIDERVNEVAEYYLRHLLMPKSATADAIHVAIATCCEIDYVLTWNCRHIANANKIRHLEVLNRRLGLRTPTLTTPYNLWSEDET